MPHVVFFNTSEPETFFFPIIKASDHKFKWQVEDREEARSRGKERLSQKTTHYMKCPAVQRAPRDGFLLVAPYEVSFRANRDGTFEWWSPVLPDNLAPGTAPISLHSSHFLRDKSKVFLEGVIKISTGWHVCASDDTKFLLSSVFTPDTLDFIACNGVLDPVLSMELNAQGFILSDKDVVTIQAGTPLLQIVPLTSSEYTFEVRRANQHDLKLIDRGRYIVSRRTIPASKYTQLRTAAYKDWQRDNGFATPWYRKLFQRVWGPRS